MNKYESVIIINASLTKEEIDNISSNIENKINEYGKIIKKEDMGIKKLAYEIKKNKEGYYIVYEFEIEKSKENTGIQELERLYRVTDEIMKFITVKM